MEHARKILRLSGADADTFLQGLVTNDLSSLSDGLVYAALLTPQGKYIADFFLSRDGSDILLDADASQATALLTRLSMYKLRANVSIAETDLHLHRGLDACPQDGHIDPRHPALGWRAYLATPQETNLIDWDSLYVEHIVPTSGVELTPESYILENGFERLNGVDFKKGCYVGQEITARMKHKTELRKGLTRLTIQGEAPVGTPIMRNNRDVGTLFTQVNGRALAFVRFDRLGTGMTAGSAELSTDP